MSTLISELNSDHGAGEESADGDTAVSDSKPKSRSVLEQMETMQVELQHLEAGLLWISVLEQVLVLRYVNPKIQIRPNLTAARRR